MKDKLNILLRRNPLFLYLLPVFFVVHGSAENYDFVPLKDAVLLTIVYIIASWILLLLFRLLYRNWMKAALMAFFIMAFHFFFGSMHDGLKNILPGAFITKYLFILPLSLCLLALAVVLLKKSKRPLLKTAFYLNILFLLLIVLDAIMLTGKIISGRKNDTIFLIKRIYPCANCNKPDVYVIITDEYAGNMELKDIFHFDNTLFYDQLAQRNFHVIPNSSSNYNFTPYSIASILNMDYLDLNRDNKQPLLAYSYQTIRNNQLLQFLEYHQYKFYNYSFFDFKGQPAHTQETFLPVRTRLITSQTFLSRLNKEIRFNLVTRFGSTSQTKLVTYANRENNETLFNLTLKTAAEKTKHPKFVLTHLMMPHYPYYYDKNGNEFPFETLLEEEKYNQQHYIENLQYTNKKLLELADHILKNSATPPVIIIMGDHGFRHFKQSVDVKYLFCNLMSVHLPGNNYSAFSDSMTTVNLFRTVLNTSFGQHLPYLKDTALIMDNQ
ncbi:MAG: hypothetical protein WDO71_13210 [Bacteroidota bacterium]